MIVGIDCGYRTGGVALIGDDHAEVHDLPVFSEGGVDVAELDRLIRTFADPEHVYIEKQGAMPNQGVSSTFKLGYAFGQITATVALTQVPFTLVTPPNMRTLQVTIFAALLMVFRFFVKLVDVDPGPNAVLDPPAAQKHNNARFARSFGVVLGTFVATLFVTFWLPQFFIEVLGLTVPAWVMLHQEVFVSSACGFVLASLVSF